MEYFVCFSFSFHLTLNGGEAIFEHLHFSPLVPFVAICMYLYIFLSVMSGTTEFVGETGRNRR